MCTKVVLALKRSKKKSIHLYNISGDVKCKKILLQSLFETVSKVELCNLLQKNNRFAHFWFLWLLTSGWRFTTVIWNHPVYASNQAKVTQLKQECIISIHRIWEVDITKQLHRHVLCSRPTSTLPRKKENGLMPSLISQFLCYKSEDY